jgi:hypothetical protein
MSFKKEKHDDKNNKITMVLIMQSAFDVCSFQKSINKSEL